MRIDIVRRELENLAHTLIDLKTISQCIDLSIERAVTTQRNIRERIEVLSERIDKITVEIGEL